MRSRQPECVHCLLAEKDKSLTHPVLATGERGVIPQVALFFQHELYGVLKAQQHSAYMAQEIFRYWTYQSTPDAEYIRLLLPAGESKSGDDETYVWKLYPEAPVPQFSIYGSGYVLGAWAD